MDLTDFDFCPLTSEGIETLAEARSYYAHRLVRAHQITCHGKPVTVVFEAGLTHPYSKTPADPMAPIPSDEYVEQRHGRRNIEVRRFNLERARLMDQILPAISSYIVSTSAQDEKRLLFGPMISNKQYVKVVLRPGPGNTWICVSAYPTQEYEVKDARRSKTARFPPP